MLISNRYVNCLSGSCLRVWMVAQLFLPLGVGEDLLGMPSKWPLRISGLPRAFRAYRYRYLQQRQSNHTIPVHWCMTTAAQAILCLPPHSAKGCSTQQPGSPVSHSNH